MKHKLTIDSVFLWF